jgi:hypothetical protein
MKRRCACRLSRCEGCYVDKIETAITSWASVYNIAWLRVLCDIIDDSGDLVNCLVTARRRFDVDDLIEALPYVPSQHGSTPAANDTCPAWTHTRTVWSEDDARTPDRERVDEAWERLFGDKLEDATPLAYWDGGDSFARLFSDGRVVWCVCGLYEIGVVGLCRLNGTVLDSWNRPDLVMSQ